MMEKPDLESKLPLHKIQQDVINVTQENVQLVMQGKMTGKEARAHIKKYLGAWGDIEEWEALPDNSLWWQGKRK